MSGTVHVVLFRGVGGATQLPTAPLRAALTGAGFDNVATYINSGNAVLRSRWGRDKTHAVLTGLCAKEFGFSKQIFVPTLDEWRALIDRNPFAIAEGGGKFLHAAWFDEQPSPGNIARLKELAINGDGFEVIGNAAYISTPNGFSKSKLAERFDKWIGVPNSARNWNTVLKLCELAEKAAG